MNTLMQRQLLLFGFGTLLAVSPVPAQPEAEVWVLRMNHTTAEFVGKAVEEQKFTAAELEDRLGELVKKGTVTELGRFKQTFSPDGEKLAFSKDVGAAAVADGEQMRTGLYLELEPVVGAMGLVALRLDFDHPVSVGPNRLAEDRVMSFALLEGDRWELLCASGTGEVTTLLLGRFTRVVKPERRSLQTQREVVCRAELFLCEPDDLKTFGRSTPATRAKAIAWLRGRGDLAASGTVRLYSGQKVLWQNQLLWVHDTNGWDTAELGMTLEAVAQVGPHGTLVDLQIDASWHPRDADKPPVQPLARFRGAETLQSGGTLVIQSAAPSGDGPVPVLFVSPELHSWQEAEVPVVPTRPASPETFVARRHPVHPSFPRRLMEITKLEPVQDLGLPPPRPAQELLAALGLPFPEGARVAFFDASCEVLLIHTAEGDALFRKILAEYDLLPPEPGAE